MSSDVKILATPAVFDPLFQDSRYKFLFGGRGGAKSDILGELSIEKFLDNPKLKMVCVREFQNSTKTSVKAEIEDKITRLGVEDRFIITDKMISTKEGGMIIFMGLQDHNAQTIKSLSKFDLCWCEEAATLSKNSLINLLPTIRKPGSEIWFSWNPVNADDPIEDLLRSAIEENERPGGEKSIIVKTGWQDNPYFPEVLNNLRLTQMRTMPDLYDHIWEGAYRLISDAQIFKGKFKIEEFTAPENTRFYFGADFGFSKDPATIIRCYVYDKKLWIDYEAGGVGIEIDALPGLYENIPEIKRWPIMADNSRPETISAVKRAGYNMMSAPKWAGSVEDGLSFMKSFDTIIIHPRCQNTAKEFRLYQYKIEKQTGNILPQIKDDNNHYIDAIRYALSSIIKGQFPMKISSSAMQRFR